MHRTNRREFLSWLGGATALTFGSPVPLLLSRALANEPAAPGERTLVLIQLAGGNDGLNTLVPRDNRAYRTARPGIGIPEGEILPWTDRWGLHPSLGGLQHLSKEGRLSVVQGVGYPDPDRSHFRSTDIWHTATLVPENARDGWLGRTLETGGASGRPFEGAALGVERLPLSLVSGKVAVPVWQRADQLQIPAMQALERGAAGRQAILEEARPSDSDAEFLRRTMQTAVTSVERLQSHVTERGGQVAYPNTQLGQSLQLTSRLIAAEVPVRVYSVTLNGFDTHAQQLAGHAALMTELSEAVTAFSNDLQARQLHERVLVVTYSEFGRRVAENGSLGTDHGAASMLFAVGGPQKSAIFGKEPSFTDLNDGDLCYTTDFRSVYATILERWFEFQSPPILGGAFPLVEGWLA